MEPTCVHTALNLNVDPSNYMVEELADELRRLSRENKRLTETLTHMFENYQTLQKQLCQSINSNFEQDPTQSRKRKAESENCTNKSGIRCNINTQCSTITEEESFKRYKDITSSPKVTKVLVKTEASNTSLYVMDGYQWRKYGQKVTRDNPSPRAYFRCSFAPSCPVKKKVQKSLEDPTILVTTYEGEHNHGHQRAEVSLVSSQSEAPRGSGPGFSPSTPIIESSCPTITFDLVKSRLVDDAQKSSIHQILVQQMANSLTRDPNFTAALATAISGKIVDQNPMTTHL
ncbi:probable WRKY transcription factor 40 [Abrus precatorius]|uniref:Probable WRKY transcription factor 40 n=1 Tax=Abrus precatorius TaxID=3816 RepID=A0A8B8JKS7_ABRPR|nr:probable WRKY transcription factor 40 [Abrus precatorius]